MTEIILHHKFRVVKLRDATKNEKKRYGFAKIEHIVATETTHNAAKERMKEARGDLRKDETLLIMVRYSREWIPVKQWIKLTNT